MNWTKQQKTLLKSCLILVFGGGLYTWFVKITGIGVPCLFHLVTGLKCPGCGISRMLLCLLAGDIRGAYVQNPFLLLTLPFLIFEIMFSFHQKWNCLEIPRWNQLLLWGYLLTLLIFGILRNV